MQKYLYLFLLSTAVAVVAVPVLANTAPVIDSFTASPAVPAPGQEVTLMVTAHDPDCGVPPCMSGCGLTIRADLLSWSDNTGRTNAFSSSTPAPTGSPWSATVKWVAPPAEGTVRVTVQIADSGSMLCGGRLTKTATLEVSVSNSRPPVVDTFTATPAAVPVGGEAALSVIAHDDLGRPLTYTFSADAGSIVQASPSSPTATWKAPQVAGNVIIRCSVAANGGAAVSVQTAVTVQIGSYLRTMAPEGLRLTRVAALPDGRIAAVDGSSNALVMLTAGGQIAWRADGLNTPVALAVSNGEIFILERGASRLSVWSTAGTQLRQFSVAGELLNGIAAGPNPGELAIADTTAARINVVSAVDGRPLRSIGVGHLMFPTGLATSNGKIAVADPGRARVLIFDAAGSIAGTYGDDVLLVRPQGVAWDAAGQRLIVADTYSAELSILGEEGAVRGSLGGFGSAAGQLVNPIDVALIPGGMVAVTTGGGNLPIYQLLNTLGPLAPPTSLQAGDRVGDDGGSISLSWNLSKDDPARVVAYRIERSQAGAPFVTAGRVDRGISSFIDSGLTDGICYTYHVIATDGSMDAVSADTPCSVAHNDLPPPAPAPVVAEAISPTSVRVNWTAVAATDLASYAIEISSAGGVARQVQAPVGTSVATVDALTPDTAYSFAIRAVDTAANVSSPAAATASTWPDIAPPVPANVAAADAAEGGTVTVTWTTTPSRVPVSKVHIVATPSVAGWPAVAVDAATSPAIVKGIVNKLTYSITATAVTPWGRTSDPSAAVDAMATAPARALPVLDPAGWDGTSGLQDAAGITVDVRLEGESRELRLQYRASNAQLQFVVDGAAAGPPLADTTGAWTEAAVPVPIDPKNPDAAHRVELRNVKFPDPIAQLAVRRVDVVPLDPKDLKSESFNSVIDLVWTPRSLRTDLTAELLRTSIDKKQPAVAVPCPWSAGGRCRDPFRDNVENFAYTLTLISPAGWRSESRGTNGHAKFNDLPPAVTDLRIEAAADSGGAPMWRLSWTPVSSAPAPNAVPAAIALYRLYRIENGVAALLTEAAAPPLMLSGGAYDPARQSLVVRSVDGQGKESR